MDEPNLSLKIISCNMDFSFSQKDINPHGAPVQVVNSTPHGPKRTGGWMLQTALYSMVYWTSNHYCERISHFWELSRAQSECVSGLFMFTSHFIHFSY